MFPKTSSLDLERDAFWDEGIVLKAPVHRLEDFENLALHMLLVNDIRFARGFPARPAERAGHARAGRTYSAAVPTERCIVGILFD